ncbi:NfeD family protein [Bacillus sp. FJAT-44742]|uniref:NfeD family protein n=1 Tax=Bacillus sp. FJAT-44742 TaxID=2014005 RepID=UPI001E43865B|nr:nodulation protein NfeD [Bacillus sp. FJAT-44742]
MFKMLRLFIYLLLIATALFYPAASLWAEDEEQNEEGPIVYFIPVEQTVERGLEAFLQRSIEDAEAEGAEFIVLEIDTPGGAVDAAGNIANLLQGTDTPLIAFVTGEAMSAGAYISLNADHIVMSPGSRMGAAQVIDGTGNAADDKAQSAWVANMISAAELNDRDPLYAQAMADPRVDLPDYRAPEGDLLSLTASEALEVGYAEAVASNREEVVEWMGIEDVVAKEMDVSFSEQLARFVTHPVVIPILLSMGSLGLILELYSPGFGIPGIMGISALLLFFFGHMFAGFAGMETFILFGAGIILMLIEIFVPGFGIFGILGIASMIGGMILASFSTFNILVSILIAVAVAAIAAIVLFKFFGQRGPMKKMVLHDSTTTEEGYISSVTREELINQTGRTLTPLRPSGSVVMNNERLDVVSEGGYIEQGRKVKVVATSGSRVVVRELKDEE